MPTGTGFLNGAGTTNASLEYTPIVNSFTSKFKLTQNIAGVVNLANYIISPGILDSIFTNPETWLSALMWYPFDVNQGNTSASVGYLQIGPTKVGENNENERIEIEDINPYLSTFFTLGEFYCEPYFNNFADYNGYTKIEIYLPFYGFVEVMPNDVMGKYIQFRLGLDYNTGSATYYIGVSDDSIAVGTVPPISSEDESTVRIISTFTFQLGVQLPLGSTNTAEVYRNIILGAVKSAGSAVSLYATGTEMATSAVSTPLIFGSAIDSLSAMHLSVRSGVANNSLANLRGSLSVQVVIYRPRLKTVGADYNHLYGRPLGVDIPISSLQGYTEMSRIHFEGDMFGTCTATEYNMIERAFSQGVLL